MRRFELWSLSGAVGPGVVGWSRRACATRDFGRTLRETAPEAEGAWGWIREDSSPAPLLSAAPGVVVDLELATWKGAFTRDDAAALLGAGGVTTHGYPVGRWAEGLRAAAEVGWVVYPQLYRPSRPTVSPEAFTRTALGKWAALGFAPESVCGLVAVGNGEYGLRVARTLVAEGAGVAVWTWPRSPGPAARAFVGALHRIAYPT